MIYLEKKLHVHTVNWMVYGAPLTCMLKKRQARREGTILGEKPELRIVTVKYKDSS